MVVLSAREQVQIGGDGQSVTAQKQSLDAAEVERLLQWRRGQLVFSGQPLSQVVEEFNRYNRTQLVIADDAIAGVKIAGSFRTTDVQGLLKFLHERHGVVVGARKNEAGRPDTIQLARSGLKD